MTQDSTSQHNSFLDDFKRRVKENRPTRWARFALVAALFFAWVAWLGTWWIAVFIILLFDIYITGYIPFTWWKKSKNALVRTVMSWVDAIVYALILVYFVFNFVGQNYQIPSSSLEKTLLTGDYLWVNKLTYGPRVPITPIHFPLVHNTLPILNCKSYTDSPELEYHRLKGLRNVELGDIVVFNFPAGDTVCLKVQNPDYYTLVKRFGREQIQNNKNTYGEIVYRPVDRRENYVKRCVALPGDNFRISNDTIYLNGVAQPFPENVQFNYLIQTNRQLTEELCHELGITLEDVALQMPSENDVINIRTSGILPAADTNSYYYILPLTKAMLKSMHEMGMLKGSIKCNDIQQDPIGYLYPDKLSDNWTLSNYGGKEGITIPKKGMTIKLDAINWLIYGRAIKNYEHNDAERVNGKVLINGKPADSYTFKMDYYFMMGDNRDNSQDSRFWGFVPEDHVVGTPMIVLISFDKDRSLFNGGIRWNRIFKSANPDK
jgi:signal peptidase I